MRARLVSVVLVALVAAGCAILTPGPSERAAPVYPAGCATKGIGAERCDRIVAWARDALAVGAREVVRIDFPEPDCGQAPDGGEVLCIYGGAPPVIVRFTFADRSQGQITTPCGGIPDTSNPLCVDDPEIHLYGPTMPGAGYRDTPEGATPVPSITVEAQERARPLAIAARDIVIDQVGPYEIELGRVLLPNGVLTEGSFGLADIHADAVKVTADGIRLEVRGHDGLPLSNAYEHGWRDGVEEVTAVLVFEVVEASPGAVLEFRDIVVR